MSDSNVDRFNGFAAEYDVARPELPSAALSVLCEIARVAHPSLVVDLGAGTGLSTRVWLGRAQRIVGIEPNSDMRRQAISRVPSRAVEYVDARADATSLSDGSADIITCVQSFHWLDPVQTLAEVDRVLRPGGVFAAFDCDWPPLVDWELVQPWRELQRKAESVVAGRGLAAGLKIAPKAEHLEQMRDSRRFRAVFELCFHQRDAGDAERMITLAGSQGGVAAVLKAGDADFEREVESFAERVRSLLGQRIVPWTYTYRARIGVK